MNNPIQYKASYPNIKFVKTKSFGHLIAQLSCKFFIANIRMTDFQKKQGQIYIQTWHGMGPKKSEKDSLNSLSEVYIKEAINDCNQTDIMLSGSKWQTDWIKNSTWYEGKILEIGTPRDDCFFSKDQYQENKSRVYSTYGIDSSVKIILYAPTFRSLGEIAQNSIDIDTLLNTFSRKFGGKYVLLLRLHPNVANQPLPESYAKFLSTKVFNATTYPDMQDLLCASDVLITDFSQFLPNSSCKTNHVSCISQIIKLMIEACISNQKICLFHIVLTTSNLSNVFICSIKKVTKKR